MELLLIKGIVAHETDDTKQLPVDPAAEAQQEFPSMNTPFLPRLRPPAAQMQLDPLHPVSCLISFFFDKYK